MDFAVTEANAPVIAEICRRLDGLPLAIELAAARLSHVSPEAMLVRLERRLPMLRGGPRDQPTRLQSMRDAIAWSYDLLSQREQALFRRLAVFIGRFSLEAAEAVALAPEEECADILEDIASLVNKSLILRSDGAGSTAGFSMLETLREFGLERLAATGELDVMQRRQATYFHRMIEEAAPHLTGRGADVWLDRLTAELPNVRASLAWALKHDAAETALRLVRDLGRYWYSRGYPGEGERWLHAALAREGGGTERADALFHAATHAALRESTTAAALARESLAVARAHDYPFGCARALLALGVAAEWDGEFDRAIAFEEEALALLRTLDEPYWTGLILTNLADANLWRENLDEADTLAEEGLALARAAGDEFGIALALGPAAVLARTRGNFRLAARLYEERLSRWIALGDRPGIGGTLAGLAGVALATRQPARAARLLGAAHALRDWVGVARLHHHVDGERVLGDTRRAMDGTAFETAWAAGQGLTLDASIADAFALATYVQAQSAEDVSALDRRTANLSPRQLDVLRLIVEGQSDRAIAEALFIGTRTVETHVTHIFTKLGVNTRAEAAALAVRQDLL
jgi:DNA-binding CsgD family transcriptional regulator